MTTLVPRTFQIKSAIAPVLAEPKASSFWVSEALRGMVAIEADNPNIDRGSQPLPSGSNATQEPQKTVTYHYVRLSRDGYCGYISSDDLQEITHNTLEEKTFENNASHRYRVCVPLTFGYSAADCKAPSVITLPMHSEVETDQNYIGDCGDNWLKLSNDGFTPRHHLKAIHAEKDKPCGSGADAAKIAKKFLHTPYRWGGRSVFGIDCSGLVQVSLWDVGWQCVRDSRPQAAQWNELISAGCSSVIRVDLQNGGSPLQKGDVLYWLNSGHTAFAWNNELVLHANAHDMSVEFENLRSVNLRAEEQPVAYRLLAMQPNSSNKQT